MNLKIGIVDYGYGNIHSVASAVEKIGHKSIITNQYNELKNCDKLILPGVGAFGDAMKSINEKGIKDSLDEIVLNKKKQILGICLGFQLINKSSTEFGNYEGFNWLNHDITSLQDNIIDEDIRIPHMGWNEIEFIKDSILLNDIPENSLFYFVHTFCLDYVKSDEIIAICNYGKTFVSIIEKDNIFATQFHPEKSQKYGLKLLENFINI